ncbi:MAG: hypothetical protein LBG97_06540 [Coriobacteriales bacterium]|jgi:hypothetical protein|nr:hypothetical protein [Coriobacteriales bacterium]
MADNFADIFVEKGARLALLAEKLEVKFVDKFAANFVEKGVWLALLVLSG